MTQHRNINPWHLLSLALAFVAGAAIFSNPAWFGQSAVEGNKAVALDSATPNVVSNAPVDAQTSDDEQTLEVAALPVPDDIPLYLQNEIEDLREQSEMAREQIDELKQTVAELSDDIENGREPDSPSDDVQSAAAATEAQPAPTSNRGRRNRGINREALIQTGVDASVIDLVEQRQDQQALARLDLLDRAAREGYSGTERLENELDELRDSSPSLQDELGDDAFDQYLYNAGNTNRVRVATIISGSIAEQAGIQLGDIIYQYGQTRVFTIRGLVSAIREGVRDEPVLVSIIREGQPLVFDVTRAPLGVTLSGVRLEPGF